MKLRKTWLAVALGVGEIGLAGSGPAHAQDIRIDVTGTNIRRVVRPGGAAHVEPRVMDVLLALIARAGRTVSRDELIEAVWGHPNVSDEALSRCVSLARKALVGPLHIYRREAS